MGRWTPPGHWDYMAGSNDKHTYQQKISRDLFKLNEVRAGPAVRLEGTICGHAESGQSRTQILNSELFAR